MKKLKVFDIDLIYTYTTEKFTPGKWNPILNHLPFVNVSEGETEEVTEEYLTTIYLIGYSRKDLPPVTELEQYLSISVECKIHKIINLSNYSSKNNLNKTFDYSVLSKDFTYELDRISTGEVTNWTLTEIKEKLNYDLYLKLVANHLKAGGVNIDEII